MARVFIGNEITAGKEPKTTTTVPYQGANVPVVTDYTDYITPLNSDYIFNEKTSIDTVLVANGFADVAQFYLTKHSIEEDVWGGQ